MNLIFALGNPGIKYQNNRHNIGQLFLHHYLQTSLPGLNLTHKSKHNAYFAKQGDLVLAHSDQYMNLNGQALSKLSNFFNISSQNTLVVHDDLDLSFSQSKLHLAKGPKQHNGLISVQTELGTDQFYRLRLGVDNRGDRPIPGHDYVLSDFNKEEKSQLPDFFTQAVQFMINSFLNLES